MMKLGSIPRKIGLAYSSLGYGEWMYSYARAFLSPEKILFPAFQINPYFEMALHSIPMTYLSFYYFIDEMLGKPPKGKKETIKKLMGVSYFYVSSFAAGFYNFLSSGEMILHNIKQGFNINPFGEANLE